MRLNLVGYVQLNAVDIVKPEDVTDDFQLVDVGLTETILDRNTFDGRVPVYFSPDCQGVFLGIPRASEVELS